MSMLKTWEKVVCFTRRAGDVVSTEGVRRFVLKDRGDAAAQYAERERAAAAAAAANADASRGKAYRCASSALHACHGCDTRMRSVVLSRLGYSCCLRAACRLDTGDGDSNEMASFTGRVWLAAASQLPKVPSLTAHPCSDSLQGCADVTLHPTVTSNADVLACTLRTGGGGRHDRRRRRIRGLSDLWLGGGARR